MVHTIEINEKKLNLFFGTHVAEMLSGVVAGSFTSVNFISTLIFAAHENYCLGEGIPAQATKGEIFRAIDNAFLTKDEKLQTECLRVVNEYNNDPFIKQNAPKEEKGGKKK